MKKQAEAEVVPSSSLVEVWVEVLVEVGLRLGVEVGVGGSDFGLGLLFRSGGWLEIWRVKLISTQVVVEVEVCVEVGKY